MKKHISIKRTFCSLSIILVMVLGLAGCAKTQNGQQASQPQTVEPQSTASQADYVQTSQPTGTVDYNDMNNWAYAELDRTDAAVDVFYLAPTVYSTNGEVFNMPIDSEPGRHGIYAYTTKNKGVYDANARAFSPYYRQAPMEMYSQPESTWAPYLGFAYEDVKQAFEYYMEHFNNGRPIILAGFSQGADHCIRLMKDFFGQEPYASQLVACYALGWRLTEEEVAEAPQLKLATNATDTGVIIIFDAEAEFVTSTIVAPTGVKTLATNPLNWATDSTPADRSLNLGACFPNSDGVIEEEIPQLTGAYIDPVRGTLKVPDIVPEDYPPKLSFFPDGAYHFYDFMFFYRNLEKNVQERINAFVAK